MYSSREIPRANDGWGKEPTKDYENEKENMQSASNVSNNRQNYKKYVTKGSDSHKATAHCNYDFKNTDKIDQTCHNRTSWYDEELRPQHCYCTGTESPDFTRKKPTAFTSNTSSARQRAASDSNRQTRHEEKDTNCTTNNEKISQEYTSARHSMPSGVHKVNKKSSRRKCSGTDAKPGKKQEKSEKQGKPDETKIDDGLNKTKPDTTKGSRTEPKSPNRSKKRTLPRKFPNMSRGSRLENTAWSMGWSWIIDGPLFGLVKTG